MGGRRRLVCRFPSCKRAEDASFEDRVPDLRCQWRLYAHCLSRLHARKSHDDSNVLLEATLPWARREPSKRSLP
jgi:hypothetical protein